MSKSSKHKKKINLHKKNVAYATESTQKAWDIKKIAIISVIAIVVLIGIEDGVQCQEQGYGVCSVGEESKEQCGDGVSERANVLCDKAEHGEHGKGE